jgi:hypothetical protein
MALCQGERFRDESFMQIKNDWLIVGVADVGMAVMNEVERFNSCHWGLSCKEWCGDGKMPALVMGYPENRVNFGN